VLIKYTPPALDDFEPPAVDIFGREWGKYASRSYTPPKIEEYLKTAEPVDGHRIILVHGLGSSEVWGANRNGDAFPEHMVGPEGQKEATLINGDEDKDWGYHTFQKYAYSFRDHKNQDPKLTIGGKVIVADWNPEMHRVEIVMPISEKLAADVVEKIDKGEPVEVSMGCFIAGTLITMADGSRKPIEDIQVGDYVLTHKGRSRKVTELHKRPYDGVFFAIRPEAHEPFVCTQEHPLLVVDRDDVKKGKSGGPRWVTKEEADRIEPKWIHAECFNPDQHYLLEPVLQDVVTPEYATREFARLLGYYVAEGHVLRNKSKDICGVEFTVNTSDIFLTEIGELAEKYGTKNPPVIRQRDNCDDAVSVQIFDAELAERLYAHGGSYAKQKKLSESFMQWHPDIQREFVGAWAEGDGHGLDSGALSISTGSDALAWQLMTVLARMDICASINCLTHKAGSGLSKKTTYEWVIHVGKQWAQDLHDVCLKIKDSPVLLAKNNRLHTGKFIITPVREMEASRNAVDVYNFEVEEDESYVAAGVAVHNCKVAYDVCTKCGNKAKNRGYYCKHARYEMGKRDPDGRKTAVLNPRPKFFDISIVKRGADRGAKILLKVASSQIQVPDWPDRKSITAGLKLSDIEKEVPGAIKGISPSTSMQNLEKSLQRRMVQADMATAEPLPPKVASLMKTRPDEAYSALTSAGIVLMPGETPDAKSLKLGSYRPDIWAGIDLEELMKKRSMYDPFFLPRVFTKMAQAKHGIIDLSEEKLAASDATNSTYRTYLKMLGDMFRNGDKLAALFKTANEDERVVYQVRKGVDEWAKFAYYWDSTERKGYSIDDIANFLGLDQEKTAALPSAKQVGEAAQWGWEGAKGLGRGLTEALGMGATPAYPFSAGVAALGAPMLMSQFYADKMMRGEDPGVVGRTVAKHPLATSAAGLLGSMKLHSAMNRWR